MTSGDVIGFHTDILNDGREITAEEFYSIPRDLGRAELVSGKLRPLEYHCFAHGVAVTHVGALVFEFLDSANIGAAAVSAGFVLRRRPDTVLGADISFLRSNRVPPSGCDFFVEGPPDLAIEINSPLDAEGEIRWRTDTWLYTGARAVWNVDIGNKSISVHVANKEAWQFSENDVFDGGDVLPGFKCVASDFFRS